MKKTPPFRSIYILVLCIVTSFACSENLDKDFANMKKYKKNTIIYSTQKYYRKLLEINKNSSYLIQDFYVESHKPLSNQYIVNNEIDLNKDVSEQESIDGAYVGFNVDGSNLAVSYKNGRKEGLQIVTDKDNKKIEKSEYKNGTLHGKHVQWWKNGNKKTEVNFINGMEDGEFSMWYKSGSPKSKEIMRLGKPNRFFVYWYENGNKKIEGSSINGVESGEWITWYPSGVISSKILFSNGKKSGCLQFNEKGEVIQDDQLGDKDAKEMCQKIYKAYYLFSLESEDPI